MKKTRFKIRRWIYRKLLGIESAASMRYRLEHGAFIRSLLWQGAHGGEATEFDDAHLANIVAEREHNRYKLAEAI